ncbi:MAG: peptidoglycan-binding protein, partial [Pseudolabrys sp.]|nr:peptidoglycan-binding protein [Pseudolabrys sp.]
AALSKSGEVLGMIETRNTMLASAEPSLPPVRLIPADTIRDFMTRNGIPQPVGGGDVRASVVRIICVRK